MSYLIYKLKSKNSRVSIVNHAKDLETAIELVKHEALKYINKKNQQICDKTTVGTPKKENGTRSQYLIEKDPNSSYVINVVKDVSQFHSGWFGTNSTQSKTLVAKFSYTKYQDLNVECLIEDGSFHCSKTEKPPPKPISLNLDRPQNAPGLLRELKGCNLFKNLKVHADEEGCVNTQPEVVDLDELVDDESSSSFESENDSLTDESED
jgi:hypothetical protein